MRLPLACLLVATPLLAQQPAPAKLDTVRVTASSRASSTLGALSHSVEVLDRAAIDRLPALTIGDVLARALGADVQGRSPASSDLSLRGSSFEQVVVLVDGVRVRDDQTGHFNLDLAVPLDQVERVEVLRGAGSALYGPDAVGGVINIVTRGDTLPANSARLQSGSFGTVGAGLSARRSASSFVFQGGADLLRSDGHRPGTDYDIRQARLSAAGPTSLGRLQADVGTGTRDYGAADFYGPYPSEERTRASTAALRLDSHASSVIATTTTVSARQHTDLFTLYRDDPARYQNRHETNQLGAEEVARVASDHASAVVGASGDWSQLRSARLGNRTEHGTALFSEATLSGDDGRNVNAGLRGDWSSTFGAFLSPSLAASLPLSESVRLRASGTRGFRAPTWTERYYSDPVNEGNPELQPETFWSAEAGAALSAYGLDVDGALFIRDARNLIDWAKPVGATPTTPWRTMNVEQATFRGVEARVEAPDLLGAAWTLRAMGLDFDARAADAYVGKYALRPITRSLSLAAAAPVIAGMTAALELANARRALEPSYNRLDVRLSRRWLGTRVDVDLVNLTNAQYLDAADKPVAGRAVYVALAWRG
jgi:iron complex outermembrane receptor protein